MIVFAKPNFQLKIKVASRAYLDYSLFATISSKCLVLVPEQPFTFCQNDLTSRPTGVRKLSYNLAITWASNRRIGGWHPLWGGKLQGNQYLFLVMFIVCSATEAILI